MVRRGSCSRTRRARGRCSLRAGCTCAGRPAERARGVSIDSSVAIVSWPVWCDPGGGSYVDASAYEPAAGRARAGKNRRADVTKSSCGRSGDTRSKAMTKTSSCAGAPAACERRASTHSLREALARNCAYDLHAVLDLVDDGCPPELAAVSSSPRRQAAAVLTNGTSDAVACSTSGPATPMPGLHSSTGAIQAARRRVSGVDRPAQRGWSRARRRGSRPCTPCFRRRHASRSTAAGGVPAPARQRLRRPRAPERRRRARRRSPQLDDFRGDRRLTTWAYSRPARGR